jgi:WD40 repeat protein
MSISTLAACGGLGGDVKIFSLTSLACVHSIHCGEYNHTLSHVNGLLVKDKQLCVFGHSWIRLHALEKIETPGNVYIGGHTSNVTSVNFQNEGKWFASAGEDGKVRIWDLRARGFQLGLDHRVPINCGTLHPNQGALVFSDRDGFVNYFDLAANKVVRRPVGSSKSTLGVQTVAYDLYNRLVACSDNNSVSIFADIESSAISEDTSEFADEINSNDDTSPRHALMPPTMIPLISRSVSNTRTIKEQIPAVHQVISLEDPLPALSHFGGDVHPNAYVTNVRLSGNESTRHPAVAISASDGSFSVWRTSHDDSVYSLDSQFGITGSRIWCWDATFVDERTRFVLAAYSDGKCRLWDTMRPSSTPAAVIDAGSGKSLKAVAILPQDCVFPGDKRSR